jgi:hypothetical protein
MIGIGRAVAGRWLPYVLWRLEERRLKNKGWFIQRDVVAWAGDLVWTVLANWALPNNPEQTMRQVMK